MLERLLPVVVVIAHPVGRPRPLSIAFLPLSFAAAAELLRVVSGGFGSVRVAGLTVLGESGKVPEDVDLERLRERVEGGC